MKTNYSARSRRVFLAGIWGIFLAGAATSSALAGLADHEVFKKMAGSWSGKGSLKNADNGETVAYAQEWTGKFSETGESFVIEGHAKTDNEEYDYQWTYTYNPTLELFEASYSDTLSRELAFEVNVNETTGVLRLGAPLGEDGARIEMTSQMEGAAYVETIVILNPEGSEVLAGGARHERQ